MTNLTKITDKETILYLKPITDRDVHIFNPCRLDVPGIGEITATSIILFEKDNCDIVDYFRFINKSNRGRILRKNGEYYLENETRN